MSDIIMMHLQLFADAGSSGAGAATGSSGEGAETGGAESAQIQPCIPDRAKKMWNKVMPKQAPITQATDKPGTQTPEAAGAPEKTTESGKHEKTPYAELIKGEYAEEHKAYMDKVISERLKKYNGLQSSYDSARKTLELIGNPYGLDPSSPTFAEDLQKAVDGDNAIVEKYAAEHDMPVESAKLVIRAERQAAASKLAAEKETKLRAEQERNARVEASAERTRVQFPDFDLQKEMQNDSFRRQVWATNGDTTAAYIACHYKDIIPNTIRIASEQAMQQTVNAVRSNTARPVENGITGAPAAMVQEDFTNMTLSQLREYANAQRRAKRR